ncbi:MAG: efflux RND transporter periplasmic adaptor subunit [Planctomycetes bacterium]|nr:efflux RND transporter periplasmic adaptor subunit [Planctomycetota bacterium]
MPAASHPENVSATGRPVTLRRRPDLRVFSQAAEERPVWVVKDPLTLEYRRLEAEEFAILQMLDGTASLADIRSRFERRFAPQRLSFPRLEAFLGRLHREGLLIGDAPGQSRRMLTRARSRRRRSLIQAWTNPLAIRFRGVDPERFLRAIGPYCGWLFSTWAVFAGLLLVAIAATLAAASTDELLARLPQLSDFFRAENLVLLMVSLAGVKVLHELGHALACKRLGGECHEIGLMLLVFTPCLYCDVSDSWTFPSRRRRAAVAAAGVYVELVLAAVAALLWSFSRPGLLHDLCLNVMVVCSVGTIVFNANPLLRYDGYYLLSDALGVANLRQRSREIVRRGLARLCLGGSDHEESRPLRGRVLLGAYAVASIAYTWFVVIAILWLLYRVLQPHGLGAAAGMLAVIVIARVLSGPILFAARAAGDPARGRNISRTRVAATVCGAAAVMAVLLWLPLPQRVSAPAVLVPAKAQPVYVTVPGIWMPSVSPGQRVSAGQALGHLVNYEMAAEIAQLEARVRELRRRLDHLEVERHDTSAALAAEAAASLPTVREALADAENRLGQRRNDQRRLTLVAPQAGAVIPPPRQNETSASDSLPVWSGSPLDAENSHAYLETGTLVCLIGDADNLTAMVHIPQRDAGLIRARQHARLKLDATPGRVLDGAVVQIAGSNQRLHSGLSRELLWQPKESSADVEHARSIYAARIAVKDLPPGTQVGSRGQVRIAVAPQSLATRLRRYLTQTFRFSL